MTDEEERADQKAIECEFAYTDLCSLQIQWRLELQMDCVAMHCNALQRSPFATPISIEFVMSTGRYTRIHTRWLSDPLFPPHPSRNAFAIALTHSTIYTQQHSIHRFAESCHSSNLHSTPLHPTFKYIN